MGGGVFQHRATGCLLIRVRAGLNGRVIIMVDRGLEGEEGGRIRSLASGKRREVWRTWKGGVGRENNWLVCN